MLSLSYNHLKEHLKGHTSITPLVAFRIAFGALMLFSTWRFILKGWVHSMYIAPKMHFTYYGFEWIKPLPPSFMYVVFALMLISSGGILLGFLYRINTLVFFLLFTYVELIDKTNYLNHYYFVSLISFLLLFLPAAHSFSLDNKLFKRREITTIPKIFIYILKWQLVIVYFFAGVAKVNADWLLEAQPLKTWLPAFSHLPLIGRFMEDDWLAYIFSWLGCLYDLTIGYFLFDRRTVNVAYVAVVVFHLATALFFNIGMFPFVMITATLIFLKEDFHHQLLFNIKQRIHYRSNYNGINRLAIFTKPLFVLFLLYFTVQLLLPFRYLLYKGNLFYTEQGYRFSWRVMLMEKAGTAFFTVTDAVTGKQTEVDNKNYLTYMQEKMMSTQPDMMLDYAHFLKEEYHKKGYQQPKVTVQSFVCLNGKGSQLFINPEVDLSEQSNSLFKDKNWVISN